MKFKIGDKVRMGKLTGVVDMYSQHVSYPLTVKWDEGGGNWFTSDGKIINKHKTPVLELVERPKRKVKKSQTVWVNCYSNAAVGVYPTKEVADEHAFRDRVACIPLTYEWEEEVEE